MTSACTEFAQSYIHQALIIFGSFFFIKGIFPVKLRKATDSSVAFLTIFIKIFLLNHGLKNHYRLCRNTVNRHRTL